MYSIMQTVRRAAARYPAAGDVLRSVRNLSLQVRFAACTGGIRTQRHTVLFCCFEGKSCADSPKAIFEYMVRSGKYDDFTFLWAFCGDTETLKRRRQELARVVMRVRKGRAASQADDAAVRSMPRIYVVPYGTKEFYHAMAISKYWILNYKVKDFIRPRRGQVFVQCWHGTPLKRLGYDITHYDHPENTAAGLARHYGIEAEKFTYFLSPSPYASEKFRSAWRLDEIGKADIIIEEGYPRNDILVNHTPEDAARVRARILRRFVHDAASFRAAAGKKIILYAPTYRQMQFTGSTYAATAPLDFSRLRYQIGDAYLILLRAHYMTVSAFDLTDCGDFVLDVSDVDDINDLYLITDLLVTDYSSVMFDFSVLRRPMIFFMYDLDYYRDISNGFYFEPQEVLPGPIVKNQAELTAAIRTCGSEKEMDAAQDGSYDRFRKMFNPYEDGHAAERVTARIFGERD